MLGFFTAFAAKKGGCAAARLIEHLVENLVDDSERLVTIARSAGRRTLDRVFDEGSYIDSNSSM